MIMDDEMTQDDGMGGDDAAMPAAPETPAEAPAEGDGDADMGGGDAAPEAPEQPAGM